MRNLILLFMVSAVLFGCGTQKKELVDKTGNFNSPHPDAMKAVSVSGEAMDILKGQVFLTSDLLVFDNYLVIQKAAAYPHYFELYDTHSGEQLTAFGLQGNGPKELPDRGKTSIVSRKNNILGVSIPNDGGAYYEISLDSVLRDSTYLPAPLMHFDYAFRICQYYQMI